jgi:hypothetical protein
VNRICKKCRKTMNEDMFYKRKRGKVRYVVCDGCGKKIEIVSRYNICRICMIKERKKYYKKNELRMTNYQRLYRERNKEYYRVYRKKWYKDNIEREIIRNREYYKSNRNDILKRRRKKRANRID